MTETRLEQTQERHNGLKSQYQNFEHLLAMNRQSNEIARQFTQARTTLVPGCHTQILTKEGQISMVSLL